MKNPETIFKEKVQRDLKKLKRAWWYKTQEVAIRGIHDIILCVNGFFVSIELKRNPKAKVDALQVYNLDRIEQSGGLAFIAYPENWESIFWFLVELDAGEPRAPKRASRS